MARALIRLSTAGPSSPSACAPRTFPSDLRKMNFKPEHLGARVVAGVRIREQVDLLVVRVAELLERFLADAGPGGGAAEQPDDRGALGAAVTGIAPADHIGRDPALPVGRPGQRDQAPLAGHEVLDFDGIADGEDVRVARAHVLVHADAAAFADRRGRPSWPASCPAARRSRGSRCPPGRSCRSSSGPRSRRLPTA